MFQCVLRTSIRFFDTTPNGQITNRFSKDVGNMDELLPSCLIDVLWVGQYIVIFDHHTTTHCHVISK